MVRLALFITLLWASIAQANCRQALALGLDVSGSVDAGEYRLQLDGLAAALESSVVQDSLFALPEAPVFLTVYEWSGQEYQQILIPWRAARDASAVGDIADTLRATQRKDAPPTTAIGAAIETGAALLAQMPECWKRTLDISGDGKNNTGPNPHDVNTAAQIGDITINGLVIGVDTYARLSHEEVELAELVTYYQNRVLAGPGAFTEIAIGFEDYERAMTQKLLRELEFISLSQVDQ